MSDKNGGIIGQNAILSLFINHILTLMWRVTQKLVPGHQGAVPLPLDIYVTK
jgi:hypothetical protein